MDLIVGFPRHDAQSISPITCPPIAFACRVVERLSAARLPVLNRAPYYARKLGKDELSHLSVEKFIRYHKVPHVFIFVQSVSSRKHRMKKVI